MCSFRFLIRWVRHRRSSNARKRCILRHGLPTRVLSIRRFQSWDYSIRQSIRRNFKDRRFAYYGCHPTPLADRRLVRCHSDGSTVSVINLYGFRALLFIISDRWGACWRETTWQKENPRSSNRTTPSFHGYPRVLCISLILYFVIPNLQNLCNRSDQQYVPPTKPYELSELVSDLVLFSRAMLKPQGRLVFFLPTVTEEYEEVDIETMICDGMEVVANSLQNFGNWGRRVRLSNRDRRPKDV